MKTWNVTENALEAAEQRLNSALSEMPEGGDAAAGAKLGQLQAQAETLSLELHENRAP